MPGKGKRTISLDELEETEKALAKRVKALATIQKSMKHKGITTIEAMGLPMVERGMRSIDSFVRSCLKETDEI